MALRLASVKLLRDCSLQEGARVAVVGESARHGLAQKIADEIGKNGGEAVGLAADVADEEAVRASVEHTAECFGGIDILINNAGMVDVKLLHEYTAEEWDRVMNVNVKSMFFAFKHALPHLQEEENEAGS